MYMVTLIQQAFNEALFWEKVLAGIISLSIIIATLSRFVKFLWTGVKEANKSIIDFLNLIPELKKMTVQFKPNGGKSIVDILNRLENHLGYTDQKIRVIASYMGIATFESDKEGLYTFVSKQWMDVMELSYDQAIGNGWINIVEEEMRDEIFREWQACIHQNREFHYTTRLSHMEDKEISIVAWPIRNIDGTAEKFFGIVI